MSRNSHLVCLRSRALKRAFPLQIVPPNRTGLVQIGNVMRQDVPRAVTTICNALQEQIEHGLLLPGSKLPAERKLSEVFDTTRITLREALVQLSGWALLFAMASVGIRTAPGDMARIGSWPLVMMLAQTLFLLVLVLIGIRLLGV